MKGALALFVKTPGLSPVKTRLAASVGEARSHALYLACADAVSELLQQFERSSGVACLWAVAEEDSLAAAFWAARGGLGWTAQGGGGLGARMARVHRQLVREHGFGILIGADAPQLQLDHLLQAAHWLDSPLPRQTLGPAEDGGFWLYGGNRSAPEALWESVTYSQPRTAREFHLALDAYGDWQTLPRLSDLDTELDLARLRAALAALPAPLPAQRRVLALLDAEFPESRHA